MQINRTKNKISKIKSQSGFTLIEVVAVLVILGALAAFAIPKFVDAQDLAKDKVLKKAVADLNGQVKLAYSNNLAKGQDEKYNGYTGYIGPDFEVTGQKINKPDSGTIKLANSSEVYTLIWTKKPAKETHGIFSLGPIL
jgi:prepilin-type N-terminal cleavage/methylation domain-containing protein